MARTGRQWRAEPQPPAGSNGPPYGLVQFTLKNSGLSKHAHEGSAKIRRGSVCLIGGADDIFVSLARNDEHDGWEVSMTIVGPMSDPAHAEIADGRVGALAVAALVEVSDCNSDQYFTPLTILHTSL